MEIKLEGNLVTVLKHTSQIFHYQYLQNPSRQLSAMWKIRFGRAKKKKSRIVLGVMLRWLVRT